MKVLDWGGLEDELSDVKLDFYCVLEMVIDMLGSILEIKFMDLVCIILLMGIVMRVYGTKGVSKVMGCIFFGMEKLNVANGIAVPLKFFCFY